MTNAEIDNRPTLEGTLTDFPIAELLGLLTATNQTGTLQASVRPAALLTVVDGLVAFASTDPAFTVRDLLVGGGVVDAELWQQTINSGIDIGGLGDALVRAGVDAKAMQDALHEQVISVCAMLVDQPVARFRFVRQSRSSMGEAFACPAALLRDRLTERAGEWSRLRTVVARDTAAVTLSQDLAEGWSRISIDRADWPVFLAVRDEATPASLATSTGLGIFETTRSIVRLWEAGAIVVDGVAAPAPGTGDAFGASPVGAPASERGEDTRSLDEHPAAAEPVEDEFAEATDAGTVAAAAEGADDDVAAVGAIW